MQGMWVLLMIYMKVVGVDMGHGVCDHRGQLELGMGKEEGIYAFGNGDKESLRG